MISGIDQRGAGSPRSLTGGLATITLEELNDLAELQTRIDRKYVVSADRAERALRSIAHRLAVLEIDTLRSFRYDSLYFDTPEFKAYRDAATRRRRRFKVRIRQYVDAGRSALEIKTRGGRGETMKERFDYQPDSVETLTCDAQRYIGQSLADDDLAVRLQPTIWTSYDRTTMVDLQDRSRITVDQNLRASRPGRNRTWRPLTDALVIETKSSAAPTPFDRALWAERVRPITISKYAIAMAVHHPELRSNRWARALHHCIDTAEPGRPRDEEESTSSVRTAQVQSVKPPTTLSISTLTD